MENPFEEILRRLDAIEKSINSLSLNVDNTQKEPEELMTREETCNLLKINSSTLWTWTNKGKVKAYGIAGRRYYKRSEILNSLNIKTI